jgi:hypothetical protein
MTEKEYEDLRSLIEDVLEKIDNSELYPLVIGCQNQLKVIGPAIDKITQTLYGNGKPGLTTVVDRNTIRLNTYDKASWAVIGIVLSLIIGSVFYLVLSHGIIR